MVDCEEMVEQRMVWLKRGKKLVPAAYLYGEKVSQNKAVELLINDEFFRLFGGGYISWYKRHGYVCQECQSINHGEQKCSACNGTGLGMKVKNG
jgi:hypothetical protein